MTAPIGPKLDLQAAIVARLGASTDLKALIGNPIRINPVQTTAWPGSYIEIGEGDGNDASDSCGSEVLLYPKIDIWSRADRSFADAEKIAFTIWRLLHNADLPLTENTLFSLMFEQSVPMRDPDGITLHIALTYRARVQIPAA